jgi:hypothetical protein
MSYSSDDQRSYHLDSSAESKKRAHSKNDSRRYSVTDKSSLIQEDEEDSLVLLFKIMLTGTIPLKQSKINTLKAAYHNDEQRLSKEYDGKRPLSEAGQYSVPFSLAEKDKEMLCCVETEILWCNGRCNGAADTPLCSSICIDLWADRVLKARKTITVKSAIARQHHSGTKYYLHYVIFLFLSFFSLSFSLFVSVYFLYLSRAH